MAANEHTRRKTELDGDSAPAVDISRQLITPGAKPPPKHRPGVASKAAAAIARRVRPSSQEALQAIGSGSVFGPAASHSDERFRQHEEAPAPYLTGA